MHDVSIAIPKKAGAGNHAEPPDKNAEYVSLRHLNMYLIFFRFSRKLKKMQNNIFIPPYPIVSWVKTEFQWQRISPLRQLIWRKTKTCCYCMQYSTITRVVATFYWYYSNSFKIMYMIILTLEPSCTGDCEWWRRSVLPERWQGWQEQGNVGSCLDMDLAEHDFGSRVYTCTECIAAPIKKLHVELTLTTRVLLELLNISVV